MTSTNQRQGFRLALGALRLVASLHALVAVLQPIWMGQYLDGVYTMLTNHAVGGGVLVPIAMLLTVTAVVYVLAGGRWWLLVVGPLFIVADGIQVGLGYARLLAVHIPLGVAIVAGAMLLAGWCWTRAAGRGRAPRQGGGR